MPTSILALAATQHGLITRRQMFGLGMDRNRVARWVRSGRLRPVHLNTFAVGGVPTTERQQVLAAVLETGHDAAASHSTAAALWGLGGFRLEPLHVVVCRASRHHLRLTWNVHQFTGRIEDHRRFLDAIPVTTPALTMLHLATMVSTPRLGRAVDNAWSLGILTGHDLDDLDTQLAARGRDGIVKLRKVASERGHDWVPPQSNIESRFETLLAPLGVGFKRQARVEGATWTARVDFLHQESRTIVEVQSERFHAALSDAEADRRRRLRLEDEGYVVVEVWDNEIFQVPGAVVDRVMGAIRRAA